ncbi:hypothetical protein CMI39_03635 [Candidatus Pacearchaeota archaeon]|jgi:hypothetical protein|nr:hypothetical protein [Candidatus Pacearchaeota archaeon]|tara:strand:+ start:12350 stop:12658 length:309 start_codon:yes stop_codon:yes gene_type:complete
MDEIKEENLVVLTYAVNNCWTNVKEISDIDDKDFSINLEKELWSYRCWKDIKIGKKRSPYTTYSDECREGIIGVYDKTNIKHLDFLVHDAIESTKDNTPHPW